MYIDIIAGARPNFMKIAPIIKEIQKKKSENVKIDFRLIHTGQHYDHNMSQTFFEELGIPEPHINLGAGGGSQAEQTSKIMIEYETVLNNLKPNLCLVVGDVTSTLACSITAKKMGVRVAHIEAGIRSNDWTMPEEINRVVTDRVSDYYFTTTEIANKNLINEGVIEDRIYFVGNTMIDTLLSNLNKLVKPGVWEDHDLDCTDYYVLTLHRPSNVDEEKSLKNLIQTLIESAGSNKIIFPVHPRTKDILKRLNIENESLIFTEPLGYLEFIYLIKSSKGVITDSGGITEETTVLGIPCLTLRNNTERPETIFKGTNELIGTDPEDVKVAMSVLKNGEWKKGEAPDKWDGKSAQRIIQSLLELYKKGELNSFKKYVDSSLLIKNRSDLIKQK